MGGDRWKLGRKGIGVSPRGISGGSVGVQQRIRSGVCFSVPTGQNPKAGQIDKKMSGNAARNTKVRVFGQISQKQTKQEYKANSFLKELLRHCHCLDGTLPYHLCSVFINIA